MTVYVRKWCREFDSGQVNVMDEQRSGRPSTSADLVQDIDALLTKGVGVLLHDSARPNSNAPTVNLLKSWGWQILPHPPYSPDLAPHDFRLFSKMKNTSVVSASN
jgi:transposase